MVRGRIMVTGSPRYLRETFRHLLAAYGNVSLASVLAASPTGNLSYFEAKQAATATKPEALN